MHGVLVNLQLQRCQHEQTPLLSFTSVNWTLNVNVNHIQRSKTSCAQTLILPGLLLWMALKQYSPVQIRKPYCGGLVEGADAAGLVVRAPILHNDNYHIRQLHVVFHFFRGRKWKILGLLGRGTSIRKLNGHSHRFAMFSSLQVEYESPQGRLILFWRASAPAIGCRDLVSGTVTQSTNRTHGTRDIRLPP